MKIGEKQVETNRLGREKSPYLLQHQHNPVDWFPWGAEAFAKAIRCFERRETGLLQQADDCHAEAKAGQLRRAKLEYGFTTPWFGG